MWMMLCIRYYLGYVSGLKGLFGLISMGVYCINQSLYGVFLMSGNETALVPQRKTLRILYHYRVGNSILAWHLFNIIGAGFGPRGAKAPKKPYFICSH